MLKAVCKLVSGTTNKVKKDILLKSLRPRFNFWVLKANNAQAALLKALIKVRLQALLTAAKPSKILVRSLALTLQKKFHFNRRFGVRSSDV